MFRTKFEEIEKARILLELPVTASMNQIRNNFKRLIKKWHPDICKENKEYCREMTENLVKAYRTIMDYCREYRYSFEKQEVEHHQSYQEWWNKQFGDLK